MQTLLREGHAAAQREFGNIELAVFLQVCRGRGYVLLEAQARIAALPDSRRFWIGFERLDGEFGDAQTAARNEMPHPFRINLDHGLRSYETELAGTGPPKRAAAFRDFTQNRLGAGGTQAAQSFNGFEPQVVRAILRQIAFGEPQQAHIRILLAAHSDFVNGERTHQRIKGIENLQEQVSAIRGAAAGDLADDAVVGRTLPLRHAAGKDLLDRFRINAYQEPQRLDGFIGSAGAKLLAQMIHRFGAQRVHDSEEQVAVLAEAGAAEATGDVLRRNQRHSTQ